MQYIRLRTFWVVALMGIVGLMILIGLVDVSPALAYHPTSSEAVKSAPAAQPPPPDADWSFQVYFTDPAEIEITDLFGNPVGTATHEGKVRCTRDNCSQKVNLAFSAPATAPSLEYKFTSRQALDPNAERVVVAGTGTIEDRGQKERFSFTATFQNNRDGTVAIRYEASRPDASFIIERTLATFTLTPRR